MSHQSIGYAAEPARLLDRHVPLGAPICKSCGSPYLPDRGVIKAYCRCIKCRRAIALPIQRSIAKRKARKRAGAS